MYWNPSIQIKELPAKRAAVTMVPYGLSIFLKHIPSGQASLYKKEDAKGVLLQVSCLFILTANRAFPASAVQKYKQRRKQGQYYRR